MPDTAALQQQDQTQGQPPVQGDVEGDWRQTPSGIVLDDMAGPDSEKGRSLIAFWRKQIDAVNEEERKWRKKGATIEKRYRDERSRTDEDGQRRFNLLWANTEIMQPALFGRCPLPVAERRFRDKDPVGRAAALVLERGLRNEIEINGFCSALELAVRDYLLPGRGVVWVRYEPEFGPGLSLPMVSETDEDPDDKDDRHDYDGEIEDPEEQKLEDTGDRIVRESCPVDHVRWADFRMFPAKARKWAEVFAISKTCYLDRDELVERFGKKIGGRVPLQRDDRQSRNQAESIKAAQPDDRKAEVHEIWDKARRQVVWMAEGCDFLLDRKDDPLKLEKFFPIPCPLHANPTTNTIVPVPDFLEYQDQAVQIDELTSRIAMLSRCCKIAGLYDAANKDLARLLDESVENELIPVDSWAALAEKGGVEKAISFLPLKEIIGVLNELIQVREKIMQDVDRLTGITDIMRGTTDARETMGAQRLKSNNTGTRLTKRQNLVAGMARETVQIMAEIMSIHFTPKSLVEVSGAMFDEAIGGDKTPATPQDYSDDLPGMIGQIPAQQQQLPPGGMPQPPMGAPQQPPPGMPPGMPGSPQPGMPGMPPGMPGAPQPGMPPMPLGAGAPPPAPAGPPVPPSSPPLAGGPGVPGLNGTGMPGVGTPQITRGMVRLVRAVQLLRDEKMRGFRVDIEVDSTIFGDAQQEKADRVEFVGAVTKFMQAVMPLTVQQPLMMPLMAKFLQFGVRGFRVGRDLEVAIEDFCDEATKMAEQHMANPQPQQPNPAVQTAQARIQEAHVKGQTEMQRQQLEGSQELQRQQVETQGSMQTAQIDAASRSEEIALRREELALEKEKLANERMSMQLELEKLRRQPMGGMPAAGETMQ